MVGALRANNPRFNLIDGIERFAEAQSIGVSLSFFHAAQRGIIPCIYTENTRLILFRVKLYYNSISLVGLMSYRYCGNNRFRTADIYQMH
jgi:hypothetical protein